MDLMDSLKSALGGDQKNNDLLSAVIELLGGKGGVNNLIGQFASNGLGDIINSWVGTGNNLPVSPEQIKSALGQDKISNLASKLGMDQGALTSQLSNLLPDVVDKLTPEGKVSEEDILGKGMDMLGGLFGNK
jgi:uncharacterized protein YidB (DUF937 family)